jgi:hypothetical protein
VASTFDSDRQGTELGTEPPRGDEPQIELVLRILLGDLTPERACEQARIDDAELSEWIRRHRRAARRMLDERVAATLAAHGVEKDDFVISGNLETMALSDLLTTVHLGRKNAHVRIEHNGEYGHLWCREGDVIDARAGELVAELAVYALLELREGRLQAEFTCEARERTIVLSTDVLLLESARRADECLRLRERIGDTSRVCLPAEIVFPEQELAAGGLQPEEAELLAACDGLCSIEDVIAVRTRPELETLRTIVKLLSEQRLLVLPPSDHAIGAPPPVERRPLTDTQRLTRPSEISVPPIVPSVTSARWLPEPVQRYGVVPIAAGALVLTFVLAFGAGSWNGRLRAALSERALAAQAPSLAKLSAALCGPTMALIPAGAGTPADLPEGDADAVSRPFCLARQLVTSGEYQACVDRRRCTPARVDDGASHDDGTSARCNAGAPGREQLPINCVTQLGAREYCEWRGQRLPTAAEWELAWRWQRDASGDERTSVEASALAALALGAGSEWTRGLPHGTAAEPELYAVLGGKTQRDWSSQQPRRMYTSASTDGLSLGFRCASDLAAGAVHEPAAASAPAP